MDTARLESALRDAGLKATRGRVAVLEALTDRPHANAETVFRTLLPTLPGTSIQNVHNVLGDLTAAGLLRRIEPAGSAALYERRIGDNHHHVVCTACGAVADVDCVVGHAPCLHPSDAGGFAIDTAEVTFWGLCPSCQERAARAQEP
ncbi:Fur family transcriptional regulator, ferric uptake regulator [Leifsonia sp. 98AMF]|uniref:Fur family transcriptional regulator n=1 Tax=unclassified Leifsonia TaxID=2663824 RepID=UPI00087C789C|nr:MULTISPECIES: Fur family transcriptional regulator [unclassified Leifsonia]SDH10341.1 Fur family transcriptional regulator, ferric uptake regulator [Leifsonia sp. 197AMF]SDJ28766.1 Fur family transcriptional regulator, ferric uptake regulator [Leifsonia sp. 466MF]SDK51996.1 Fur family transcriptional regulator, ferric uptake regulator [Leifsonia sp. 157MF]SDN50635.1 Fur family transcriptional regulator, ferric uptake regulator [Leifsonia sp. 509MF]SEN59686.1 Fur family transcriptional regul